MPQRFCHVCAKNHTLLFCVWLMERGTSEQLPNPKDGYLSSAQRSLIKRETE
jgi:hypothetical protein